MEWIYVAGAAFAFAIGILVGRKWLPGNQGEFAAISEKAAGWQSRYEQVREQASAERAQMEARLGELRSMLENSRADREQLAIRHARLQADHENLAARSDEYRRETDDLRQKFHKEFENLANRILEEKSQRFTEQNRENLHNMLHPLQEKIQLFEKKVDDTHKESIVYHSALREHIGNIMLMNQQMSRETVNLTRALKGDSKMQGNWGELVLERVLEKSGLERGREYDIQQSFTTDGGSRMYPDVVVNLPDGKKLIIDSKVSLTAYERCCNEEDEVARNGHLREHVASIRRHVEQLGAKNYHHLYKIDSPDFVLLFIPIEPAFALALREDPTLYNKAFERNIVIVTPATLLATLRTIDSMWTNRKQQENAIEIARQAGALYDKFEGLISDLSTVGKKMEEGRKAYDEALKKLHTGNGNLIGSVEKLKRMGAKAKKSLPEDLVRGAAFEDKRDDSPGI